MCEVMNNQLDKYEMNEDEGIFTTGDDICSQFYYGNFSEAVEMMKGYELRAKDIVNYIEAKAEEYGCEVKDLYNGHFSPDFWVALGSKIY